MNDIGTFEIVGTVRFQPRGIGLKIETVDVGKGKTYKTTHEVLCFDKLKLSGLQVGDRVRVTGHLGAKKSEYTRQGSDGKPYAVYLTQLIARVILPAEEGETKARHITKPATSIRQESLPVEKTDDEDLVPF